MLTKDDIFETLSHRQEKLRGYGVKKLGLFGSYAKGEASEASDLDFLVEFDHKSFDTYMDLKFFLEDTFHHKVDLILADRIKPRLREHILQEVRYAS